MSKPTKPHIETVTPEMDAGPWTLFWDMHSGGHQNTPYAKIYIQANEDEATAVLGARFGQNPHSVNCNCCGSNYSVSEYDSLSRATGFHRNDREMGGWRGSEVVPLLKYINQDDVIAIFATDILPGERDESNVASCYEDFSGYEDDDE